MKKTNMMPVYFVIALLFVLFTPKTTCAVDFSSSMAGLPSSVSHGETLEVTLNVHLTNFVTMLAIIPDHKGLTYRSSSIAGSSKWEIVPDDSNTALSVTYTVNNDVTDHILVRFYIFSMWPGATPPSKLLECCEIPVVHDPGPWTVIEAPTCTTPGLKTTRCTYCDVEMKEEMPALDGVLSESGHVAGDWVETVAATNKTTGMQEKYCTLCGKTLETKTTPILSEIWPNNTACSLGPRFRDEDPALTDKWYMYTPVDLTQDGVKTYPLIASNVYIIGSVSVTVEDGNATVAYTLATKKIKVKEEFLTFLPGLEGLDTVEPEEMADRGFKLNEPFPVNEKLKDAGGTLMFLRLVIDYDIYADGVKRYYEGMYKKDPGSL